MSKGPIRPSTNELSVPEICGSSILYRNDGIFQPEKEVILETTANPAPQGNKINPTSLFAGMFKF